MHDKFPCCTVEGMLSTTLFDGIKVDQKIPDSRWFLSSALTEGSDLPGRLRPSTFTLTVVLGLGQVPESGRFRPSTFALTVVLGLGQLPESG